MDNTQLLARLAAGFLRLRVGHKTYLLFPARLPQRYEAALVYADALADATRDGLYTADGLLDFLLEQDLWTDEDERLLESLPREAEEFKVALYQATFKSNEQQVIRKSLRIAEHKFTELYQRRHAYDHLGQEGCAAQAQARYLIACGLQHASGLPVFDMNRYWRRSTRLLDEVILRQAESRVSEASIRRLARTEPWRSLWAARTLEKSLFGTSPLEYTDEQQTLVRWSLLYDRVYEHAECPSDDIIDDDDRLDGWFICQRRARSQAQNQQAGESKLSEATRHAQEVFLVADTIEDARKIQELNASHARATIRQREKVIAERGVVQETELPDVKRRIQLEAVQAMTRK